MESRLASVAFVAVLAAYLLLGGAGVTDRGSPSPADAAYNLLSRGLLSGHLYVAKEAPAALTGLADPYDPDANRTVRDDPRYRLHDFSYFGGRLYLYFGVAPALLVFIPWHLLTGGWLPHWIAVVLLCSGGLLVNLSLLRSVKWREFPGAEPWLTAACTLVLGLGSYAPLLVARGDMWEVPIAFGYLCVSAALRCLWGAYCAPQRPVKWIAFASLALGAAFAARPTVLPNAAILLFPFLLRETRRNPRAWAAAIVPLALCGAAVGAYNALRFGSPFDFGMRYQLASVYVARLHAFSPSFVWTNLRFYLFQAVQWSPGFPFVHEPALAPLRARLPAYHGGTEQISGALLNAPVLWAALAVPVVAWKGRADRAFALLALSAAWVALSSLALLSFFFGACSRYQFEFVPEMALLASLGILALETGTPGAPRVAARCLWIGALALSCAFPVLYGVDRCASDHNYYGVSRLIYGDTAGAEHEFETARSLSPGNPFSRLGFCLVLISQNRRAEGQAALEELVRDHPEYAKARLTLGNLLAGEGRRDDALAQLRAAQKLDPDDATIAAALGSALRGSEAPRK
jgi:tetratricopeptide (TPR) repeat protein